MKNQAVCFLIVLFIGLFFLPGCKTPATQPPYTGSSSTAQFDIFRDGEKPTRPYKEIDLLKDDGRPVEQEDIEAKMIKKAKKMGGSAIIFKDPIKSGEDNAWGSGSLKVTYLYKGIVIVYE
jgi:hypothetical protein